MGVVDLARDGEGNRVALKRLTLTGSANEILRARQRLLREAEVLRRLHHPNVVRLIDVLDEGDEIVLVMPYLPGGSLAERVVQHGPAPADEVERQARRLFGALASAHQAGIVHRDIKPANILFDERGEPCLADFGVAHSWDQTHGLTVAGMVVGTPGFMSPEQARGDAITPASDVFSLGATLLYAATGEGPFGPGEPALLMVRAASGKVERVPRSLRGSLRELLRSTLDPRPERRPTAAALVDTTSGVESLRQARWGRARRRWGLVGGTVGVAALAALVVSTTSSDGDSDAADRGPDPAAGCEADLPYQPCGQPEPAPHTDGARCLADHEDYDGDPENGCEAVPDRAGDTLLVDDVRATIVPSDDVDVYTIAPEVVTARPCGEPLALTLVAPAGMDLRLEVVSGGAVLDEATTAPDRPAVVMLGPERCAAAETGVLEAVVTPLRDGRVAEPYLLQAEIPDGP